MNDNTICKGIIMQKGTRYTMIVPHRRVFVSFDDGEPYDGEFITVRKLFELGFDPHESGDSSITMVKYQTKSDIVRAVRKSLRDDPTENTAKEKLKKIRDIIEEGAE